MQSFEYTIKDNLGIHARPAGLLVKCAKELDSKITIKKGERIADAKKLFAIMGLGVRCEETVVIEIDGGDEEAAMQTIKNFFEENL